MPSAMSVTLRQLRAFLAVAEEGRFTRAADRLKVSQSTVSALVRDLEANLALRLFDRHTRMLRLTQAGEEIVPLARKTLADLDHTLESLGQLHGLARGRVTVAASSLQSALFVPQAMQVFARAHPGIEVVLFDVPQAQVLELVRSGGADLGLGTDSGNRHDLIAQVMSSDTFACVMQADHPLTRLPVLTWREIEPIPVIGPPAGDPLREQLDFALARSGISLRRGQEVSLPLTVLGMVAAGVGVAVMTTNVSPLARALGLATREITNPVVRRQISLLCHAERSLSPAAQRFRATILRMKKTGEKLPDQFIALS